MRVDKLLANMGYGSRKEVKKLLKSGALNVNKEVVKDGKVHVNTEDDEIEIFGELIEYRDYIYIMMNKPKGVISATEDNNERTVVDLLEPEDALFEPFPVGRLDKDTTGLMLLTNDGKLTHQLTSPKKKVDKRYRVHIDAPLTVADEEALKEGVELDDGYVTKPAKLSYPNEESKTVILLTITEGKFHQVKRMFKARGRKVVALKRERIGSLLLDPSLEPGTYRELTDEELHLLYEGETK
ncbi:MULTISPECIES: pseudouridine synthase [Bacillaceae]|uniref:Pseudouridine synthase n=1 Tax=Evansella alkalicola TaxID=745819 RepID=A0ABS6JR68_9BACI|nr:MULTISPECIES: pseudouridine synthase [Bacillaceae]MBU9721061.1 rRNA pseudouridine synthase [Bacillus alkalicola]